MSRLLYSVGMSVDGYVTGPGGDMSWMTAYLGPNPTVDALVPDIGALLVGRRTFDGDDPHRGDPGREGKAFGGQWSGPQFVITHDVPSQVIEGVTFVNDFDAAVKAATAAAGDHYVNVLGADIARQCLETGVLDEVLVCIAPVMLGDGVRLLDVPGGARVRLQRLSVTESTLATNLWFRIER